MTRQATQRLLDAAAQLDPADRALLSLLINHGLHDDAIARMMHLSPPAIALRRKQLIDHLSASIGLPPTAVEEALQELAVSARGHSAGEEPAVANGAQAAATAPTATNGGPGLSREASSPIAEVPAAVPERAASGPRRGRRAVAAAALGLLLAVVLVIVLSAGTVTHAPMHAAAASTTAVPSGAAAATPPPPSPRRRDLAALPGGPAGVTGSATVLGPAGRPRLVMSTAGLPAPGRGHYEVWLYNSILDAVPLVRLRAPADNFTVALPSGYRRYRWLDVSLQPAGAADHSGESILRVALAS